MSKKALIILGVILCACGNKDDSLVPPPRSEYIKVYETSPEKTVDNIQVPFEGVQDGKIHVLTNVGVRYKYLVDPSDTGNDWLTIKSVEEEEPGHIVVTYDAESIFTLNSIVRRSRSLSFSCPEAQLGKFLSVRQGYSRVLLEEFTDEPDNHLTISGRNSYTTEEYPKLGEDYYDYISFNAWAESNNDFMTRNITLDITISGGQFHDTGLSTFRVNVPLGSGPDRSNLKYLLVKGNDGHMSAHTCFTFSASNDEEVYVHLDNFAVYTVSVAELGYLIDDEETDLGGEEADWI